MCIFQAIQKHKEGRISAEDFRLLGEVFMGVAGAAQRLEKRCKEAAEIQKGIRKEFRQCMKKK